MNEFLANPTISALALYYAASLLNFLAALWMATAIVHMRESDYWPFRMLVMLAGLVHAIIAVSMFKNPDYAPHASSLVWWWAIALLGVLALINTFRKIPPLAMRILSYLSAVLAFWGAYMVFEEQAAFNELATYYGFFAANMAAAIWLITNAILNDDLLPQKRLISLGTGTVYAILIVTAVATMQMVLESPY